MSIRSIPLRKLLQLFYMPDIERKSELRKDIRAEIRKSSGLGSSTGGDFYVPFWADVRAHVADERDLSISTANRIAANSRRKRLYPLLESGFLTWWNEKRRWINEPYDIVAKSPNGQYNIPQLKSTIRIENILLAKVGGSYYRVGYPYFSEIPALPAEGARVGLWVLKEALSGYDLDEFRILDIIRGTSFSTIGVPLNGNENSLLKARYANLLEEWEALRKEYK